MTAPPHFTTLAAFVSGLGDDVARLFAQVLYLCDRQGLIGRAMFAIDGVKLPSNAAKAKSGTRADFIRQAEKLEAAAQSMLARHRENDTLPVEPALVEKSTRRIERLNKEAAQLRHWLSEHPHDRKGRKGSIRKRQLQRNHARQSDELCPDVTKSGSITRAFGPQRVTKSAKNPGNNIGTHVADT